MALNAKEAFSMVKQSAKDFGDDDCPRLAAALAYYIVFALPPLLILIMKIVGTFVSQEQVQSALSGQFGQMIGSDGAKTVQTMIASAKQPGGGVLSTVLGIDWNPLLNDRHAILGWTDLLKRSSSWSRSS